MMRHRYVLYLIEWISVCGHPFPLNHLDGPVLYDLPRLGVQHDDPVVEGLDRVLEAAEALLQAHVQSHREVLAVALERLKSLSSLNDL